MYSYGGGFQSGQQLLEEQAKAENNADMDRMAGLEAGTSQSAADAASDPFKNSPTKTTVNNYQSGLDRPYYGGYAEGAYDMSNIGLRGMGGSQTYSDWASQQAQRNRGPQAYESQQLSDQEAYSRGYDQSGALQLQREAAMGQAPSEAAYLMQMGLDRGAAQQSAMRGGARGVAALANAQGNAQGAVAGLQNQAFMQGGALRAQEMAQARGAYGDLASQVRSQDQNRLGMGNQMAQYNASLNDQYRMGMGQLGNQYGQTALGWYGASQQPYNTQAGTDQAWLQAQGSNNALTAAKQQADIERSRADRDFWLRATGAGVDAFGKAYGGMKGS